jgi:hypothetical protein
MYFLDVHWCLLLQLLGLQKNCKKLATTHAGQGYYFPLEKLLV